MRRRNALGALASLALPGAGSVCACREQRPDASARDRLVFKHQPLGDGPAFAALLDGFERAHPGAQLTAELVPNDSDLAHQFFLTALEGGSAAFDVLVVDIVWVREFVRAGWILDLSSRFPAAALRRDFLPGAAETVIVDGRVFAVPWYVDVGLLYRRLDLVPEAPATYEELVAKSLHASASHPDLAGFVWQGRQYEGLVCNVYEAIWGHGGRTMAGDRLLLDTPEARAALRYLRSLFERGVSPRSVASAAEEDTRRTFQSGRAVFMRNWPYAWAEAERPGSKIRGKVGVSALPTVHGGPGPGTLGGYQLAINARVPAHKRELALELVAYLTSLEANLELALGQGRNPALRAAYAAPRLKEQAPNTRSLLPMFEAARPRPTTPYYAMLADTLQAEFSAAITGIRSPAAALERAQALADHIMDVRPP